MNLASSTPVYFRSSIPAAAVRSNVTGLPVLSISTLANVAKLFSKAAILFAASVPFPAALSNRPPSPAVLASVTKLNPWSEDISSGILFPEVTVAGTEVLWSVRSSKAKYFVFLFTSKSSTSERGFRTPYLLT